MGEHAHPLLCAIFFFFIYIFLFLAPIWLAAVAAYLQRSLRFHAQLTLL